MQALLKALTRFYLRVMCKPWMGSSLPLSVQRRWAALLGRSTRRPKGVDQQELWVGDVRMLRMRSGGTDLVGPAELAERDAILFVHGGCFVVGGGSTYDGFAAWLAEITGADVYFPDYRLAPEHPHPAPLDDLFEAYRVVLELGHSPRRVAIVGDSAGGALAVGTVLSLPEMGLASPAALVLLSPFLDLSLSGGSVAANARRDPFLSVRFAEMGARAHAGGLRLTDPHVSPLFADLRRLPPTLIQVGTDEILLDDSTRFADRAWAASAEVDLQRFDGLFHDFQTACATLEVSRSALEDVAAFLRRRLGR
jgi:monoterpene epsilon-lactone hydrolase